MKLNINSVIDNNIITLYLSGSITADNAHELEDRIDEELSAHPECHIDIDANKLDYVSSTGLRVFLKLAKRQPQKTKVLNVSLKIYELFEITGFISLMDISKKKRNISIKNCPKIGEGRSSNVYRIDADTIVKCYKKDVPIEMIEKDMDYSKKSLLAGIPTAISYDLVTVDHSSYGVVFELISAVTVGNMITNHMELFDEIVEKFTSVYKLIHSTTMEGFPSVKDTWNQWLDGMRPYYSQEDVVFMQEMINSVPERNTMVHCDFHENNVLYQDGDLIIIDMGDVSYGHPIFDLAGGSFRAHCSMMPNRPATHGLSPENMERFCSTILRDYFNPADDDELKDIREICDAYGYLRSALFPMKHVEISAELRDIHIADARENLLSRKEWARDQMRKIEKYFK